MSAIIKRVRFFAVCCAAFFLVLSCGQGVFQGKAPARGDITSANITINLPVAKTLSGDPSFAASDFTITVTVTASDMEEPLTAYIPNTTWETTMEVPSGDDRTFTVTATSSSKTYTGSQTVDLVAGETETLEFTLVSGPTVSSTSPAAGGTNVAVTTSVTATFSEAMDSSTMTTTTFTVSAGSSSVEADTVTYDSQSQIATLTFVTNLTANTTYTCTITTGVKNSSGTAMLQNHTWTFTTAAAQLPETPASQSASAGNKQVTISWTAVTGDTSYNIYWNTSGSVSTSDTKIAGTTNTSYTHTGLTNFTTYYYRVTAVDSNGESGLPSSDVFATCYVPN